MSENRADPFGGDLDLSDFVKPTREATRKPPVSREIIRDVSEANNFPSRAAGPKPPRRRRTGRNIQLALKVTQATHDQFIALADKHGLVFGELLQKALESFEKNNP